MRKKVGFWIAVTLSAGLVGCGSNSTSSPPVAPNAKDVPPPVKAPPAPKD